jgi:nitrogenase molybdenum-iron protein alpha/beta subunit
VELNVLPDGAGAATFRAATSARLSVPLDQDTEDYLGVSLRDEYGVPYIEAPRPVGLGATGRWLAAVGAALGLEEKARLLHEQESAAARVELAGFSLLGVRVYLGLPTASAFGVLELVQEFGGEVVGITVSHLDQLHRKRLEELSARHPDLQIHVADGQPFEEVSILKRMTPDLYLGDSEHLGQIGRLGGAVVSLEEAPILGYRGLVSLAGRISLALSNLSFGAALARTSPPYHDAWYRRSSNWHIKQEVK